MNVKWIDADSSDGNYGNFHGYKPSKRTHEYFGEYDGNSSLCNKNRGIIDEDGETFTPFEKLISDKFDEKKVCKNCLKIYKNEVSL
jgi:hypothetical protein